MRGVRVRPAGKGASASSFVVEWTNQAAREGASVAAIGAPWRERPRAQQEGLHIARAPAGLGAGSACASRTGASERGESATRVAG